MIEILNLKLCAKWYMKAFYPWTLWLVFLFICLFSLQPPPFLPISRVLLYNLHWPLTRNPLASFSDCWDCRYGAEIGWVIDSSLNHFRPHIYHTCSCQPQCLIQFYQHVFCSWHCLAEFSLCLYLKLSFMFAIHWEMFLMTMKCIVSLLFVSLLGCLVQLCVLVTYEVLFSLYWSLCSIRPPCY